MSQVKSEFAFPFQMHIRVISHSKLQEQPLLADQLSFSCFPSYADMDMSLRNTHKHLEQPRASPARPHADSQLRLTRFSKKNPPVMKIHERSIPTEQPRNFFFSFLFFLHLELNKVFRAALVEGPSGLASDSSRALIDRGDLWPCVIQ